ncbi:MAG TPA: hypothetical protein VKS43_11880, partial [Burkholderiales bacterium]|nr:hypothetical protein [Burkholderiales bacterium]
MDKLPALGALAIALSGCTSIPPLNSPVDPMHKVNVNEVVELAKCSVKGVMRQYTEALHKDKYGNDPIATWIEGAKPNITVQLTLKADSLGNISPSFTRISPIADVTNALSKFTGLNRSIGLSINYSETDTRQLGITFTMNVADLDNYSCGGKTDYPIRAESPCGDGDQSRMMFNGVAAEDVCNDLNEWTKSVFLDPTGAKASMLFYDWAKAHNSRIQKDVKTLMEQKNSKQNLSERFSLKENTESLDEKKLGEAITQNSQEPANNVSPFDSLTYALTFSVVKGGGFTPSVKLVHFT